MKKNHVLLTFVLTAALISATGNNVLSKPPESNPGLSKEFLANAIKVNDLSNKAAAKHLDIPVASILACREAGYGLLFTMFLVVIADEAEVPIEDAIEARESGHVWGEMCEAWDVSWEEVIKRISNARKKMREEKVKFPPPTVEESHRAINNGAWRGPLRGKP